MKFLLCGALGMYLLSTPHLSQSHAEDDVAKFVLTDTEVNHWVRQVTLSPKKFGISGKKSAWSIKKEILHGGKQDGVDLLTVHNGTMSIRIIPTRGMSIYDMQVDDFRLGWQSPVKEIVHPKFVDLDTRGGLGWLDGFNEWMVRCGLEFAGHPGVDKFIDNTGAEAEMNLTLHGKVGNIPASKVEVLVEKEAPHRITVRGTVHERMFFGPKLELVTEISTIPNSTEITVTDRITNHGAGDQEFVVIYHTNYGAPMLEAGAKLIAPVKKIMPMNETAIPGLETYSDYAEPKAGYVEQVFLTQLYADEDGRSTVCLVNKNQSRGTSIRYDTTQLPYFTIWKNTTALEDGYVTGLEPGTAYPFNRNFERSQGRIPKLMPGESREFALTFGIHLGKDQVQEVTKSILEIQGKGETEFIRSPPTPQH